MKVPFSWLKKYVDIDIAPEELEEKLFGCGFEVEELIRPDAEIERVVVGVVTSCEPIEGTHLHLCLVDCGEYGHDIQICTGADNVYAGMHTPAALDGSHLPGGVVIKAKPLRGIPSAGMLCSGEELGLNDDLYPGAEYYGLLELPKDTVPGEPIAPVVGLDDCIFDIDVTANRPDCQSVLGTAREVAAILNKPFKMPALDYEEKGAPVEGFSIRVEAPELCPRYLGHQVRDLRIGESPRWMKRALALCGLRSINNIVDITNYVMLETGQPMHAFDRDTLESREIIVRRARADESITTLDGKAFKLGPENLVICDGEKPVALAGVMGGLNSEITDRTKELLFEAAKFARDSVRKTARSLGQNTDASGHFEKGISEYTVELGMERALHLIEELDCGDIAPNRYDCDAGEPKEGKTFTADLSRINEILGVRIPEETALDILRRLDFKVEKDGERLTVTAPRWREDIEVGEPDLAEELIRMYGFQHIKPTFLTDSTVTNGGKRAEGKQEDRVKNALCAEGFCEAMTMSFYAEEELNAFHLAKDAPERSFVRIMNPINANYTIMRTLLAPSLLKVVVGNLKKGNTEGRLFELANIYTPEQAPHRQLPKETKHLCLAAFGEEEDFFSFKGAFEDLAEALSCRFTYERAEDVPYLHPGIAAYVLCEGERIGCFGKIANIMAKELDLPRDSKENYKIFLGELDYERLAAHIPAGIKYQSIPTLPDVKRDLSLVAAEDADCGEIEEEIKKACAQVSAVELFDIYRGIQVGIGKKSMSFKISFRQGEKPLDPETEERYVKKILGNLKFRLGIEIRG